MAKNINRNIHDRFFKGVFENLEVTREFLQEYLPEDIVKRLDLSTIHREKETFIDQKMDEYITDTLYSVKLDEREAFLYFLFEHKSYTDKEVSFQLLEYMAKIYRNLYKSKKYDKIPVVFPIVIYHGKSPWNQPLNFAEFLDLDKERDQDLLPYIPDFVYKLYDIPRMDSSELKGHNLLMAVMLLLRMRKHNRKEILELIKNMDKIDDNMMFEMLCRYMLEISDVTLEEISSIIETAELERKEDFMTLGQRLREEGMEIGLQKGKLEGIQEGEKKKALSIAEGLLGLLSEEMIAEKTGLTLEEVKSLKKKKHKHQ